MSALLPPNATPLERALQQVIERLLVEAPIPIRALRDPETCPAAWLPWLAWERHVDTWRDNWPIEVRRAAVAQSWRRHQQGGTPAGDGALLAALGAVYDLEENPFEVAYLYYDAGFFSQAVRRGLMAWNAGDVDPDASTLVAPAALADGGTYTLSWGAAPRTAAAPAAFGDAQPAEIYRAGAVLDLYAAPLAAPGGSRIRFTLTEDATAAGAGAAAWLYAAGRAEIVGDATDLTYALWAVRRVARFHASISVRNSQDLLVGVADLRRALQATGRASVRYAVTARAGVSAALPVAVSAAARAAAPAFSTPPLAMAGGGRILARAA